MPDVFDRDGKEAAIARVLGREFNRARMALLGLIPGLEEWMTDVAPEFWGDHRANLVSGVTPLMSGVYVSQAATMLDEFEVLGVDWGLVNESAVDWARRHTYDLVTGLTDTSRRTLQKLIPGYFENQWTQGQLRDYLTPTFGSMRAEMIARTEVTNAASEGEQETARLLAEQGIVMQPVWQTRNDEIVQECPICWPRHNQPINDGEYPAAHPRCRCWVTYEIIPIA